MTDNLMRVTMVRIIFGACLFLTACTIGDNFDDLRTGMSRGQVIAMLGDPDGVRHNGNAEALTYTNRRMSSWGHDRADYHVILTDGQVSSYGVGNVRENSPRMGMLWIAPMF